MSELKPCPFCGASPEIITDKYGTWGTLEHKPDCLWYFSNFPKHVIREQDFEKWNTRYERTCRAIPKEPRWSECECSVCGGALESFNQFCPNCGAKVVAVDERTCKVVRYDAGNGVVWLTCSECGNIMPEHDNYCSSCGARVVDHD